MDINSEDIKKLLITTFSTIDFSGFSQDGLKQPTLQICDNVYQTINSDTILTAVSEDKLLKHAPFKNNTFEAFDCDDVSLQVKALLSKKISIEAVTDGATPRPLAIGIIFTVTHALNIVFTENNGSPVLGLYDATLDKAFVEYRHEEMEKYLVGRPIYMIYI